MENKKQNQNWLLALLIGLGMCGCATNPNKAVHFDTAIEHSERAGADVTIGIKDGEMVAQRQVLISEELRRVQNEAYALEAKVYGGDRYLDNNGMWGVLRSCNVAVAKAGADMVPMSEKRAYVIPEEDYKIGLDDSSKMIGLHREYLKDRLHNFQQYKQVLIERSDEYQDKIDLCNMKQTIAKVMH